jgi:diguanylate cyclase (GGDEF)-like protein/PAS domain S-box-containing protein
MSRVTTSGGFRLLMVSDSPGDADLACSHLDDVVGGSCEAVFAGSLVEAAEWLAEGGVAVIVLSLTLPDSSGVSTFQRMREMAPGVPVIVLAKHGEGSAALRAMKEGAQGFVGQADLGERLFANIVIAAVERQRAESGVRIGEKRCVLAVDGSGDGLWHWNLETDTIHYSARWGAIRGLAERAVDSGPERWLDRVHPEDRPALESLLAAHLVGASRRFECEHRVIGAAGDYQWVLARGMATSCAEDGPRRVAGTMTDIATRKEAEQQLLYHTLHDELTGLANRALFMDRLEVAIASLQRGQGPDFGVLFMDLDRFKNVNDFYGHSMGDRLLIAIARRLQGFLRPGDTLARLGGDEFAIVLADVSDAKAAVHVANRIRELLERPFTINGHELEITASTGIALSTTGYEEASEILHDADIAMYRAKSVGLGACQVFDPDMHETVVSLLKLENELREAVERKEFVVHFQPVVALDKPRVVGFEGLVRWRHPEKGLMSPSRFMAVAKESGLIVPIDWWALGEACRQGREWQKRFPSDPPLWISMNLSGKLLTQVDAVERIDAVVATSGFDRTSLRLELPESVLQDHGETAISRLEELRELGFMVTIDDFGSQGLSLDMFDRLHYDSLKIDPSFVSGLGSEAPSLLKAILGIADSLGMNVIAEGVETADQARHLRELHCPQGQGFWFARPVSPAAAEQLLATTPRWWTTAIN